MIIIKVEKQQFRVSILVQVKEIMRFLNARAFLSKAKKLPKSAWQYL